MLENLEPRRLLAIAAPTISGGVLTINGTNVDDNVSLTVVGTTLTVRDNLAAVNFNFGTGAFNSVVINGNAGNDTLLADGTLTKPMTINGGVGNDNLRGGNANDTLNGNDGNDTLVGNNGADVLNGGLNNDTADYSGKAANVVITIGAGANDGTAGENDNVAADVETVIGGLGNDTITGNDSANSLAGGNGNDSLIGLGGNDLFDGGIGNDTLDGGLGSDNLVGGTGDDTATYATRTEALTITLDGGINDGAAGENDNAFVDIETVIGGTGNDNITGNNNPNSLSGGNGNDVLIGMGSNDLFDGGAGDDTLDGGLGSDNLVGGAGLDVARYTDRSENLFITMIGGIDDGAVGEFDNVSVEAVKGGSGNDSIIGTGGNDYIEGGTGKDTLRGGGGNDTIIGSGTDDSLFGDAGADFLFAQDGIADLVDGGADTDAAQVDAADTQPAFAAFAAGFAAAAVGGGAGQLDPSFNDGGYNSVDFGNTFDTVSAVRIQSDGKILVAGSTDNDGSTDFGIARFNPDGTLDNDEVTGFGVDHSGFVKVGLAFYTDTLHAMVVLPDDSIILAGETTPGFGYGHDVLLAKLDADGAPDLDFGTNGQVLADTGADEYINDLAVDANGRIVAVGIQSFGEAANGLVMAFNPNGSPDTDFGDGSAFVSVSAPGYEFPELNAVVIDSDNNIITGGTVYDSENGTNDFVLFRLTSDGGLDPSFFDADFSPAGGVVVTDLQFHSADDGIFDLALTDDGKIVAAGYSETIFFPAFVGGSGNANVALARYNNDGTLDTTFHDADALDSTLGTVVTEVSVGNGYGTDSDEAATGLAITADNQYVISGYQSDGGSGLSWLVGRYNNDGMLDSTFEDPDDKSETPGIVISDFGNDAAGIAVQEDGKIVVGGTISSDGFDFGVARYLNDAPVEEEIDGVFNIEQLFITQAQLDQIAQDLHFSPELLGPILGHVNNLGQLVINGTNGNDVITMSQSGSTITVTINGFPQTHEASGINGIVINGLDGNDVLKSSQTITIPTTIRGGNGNDTLTDGAGDDELDGGAGDDVYAFQASSTSVPQNDIVTEAAGAGTGSDTLDFSALAASNPVVVDLDQDAIASHSGRTISTNFGEATNFENATGGAGADSLSGNAFSNRLIGGGGSDALNGRAGDDTYGFGATIGTEIDTITEVAGGGSDTIDFATLTLAVTANLLSNTLTATHTGRTVKMAAGTSAADLENIVGGSGNDNLTGNNANNRITGGNGNDTATGNAGNDTYIFGAVTSAANDTDTIREVAGGGTDTIDFSALNTTVLVQLTYDNEIALHSKRLIRTAGSGQAGQFENVIGSEAGDLIYANAMANNIHGGGGNDLILGADGNDSLFGDAGNDTLFGGNGNDRLEGGIGGDSLSGDAGNDTFIAKDSTRDTLNGGAGTDTASGANRDANDILNSVEST